MMILDTLYIHQYDLVILHKFYRYGGGFLLVEQSGQCSCGWHRRLPIWEKSGSRDWKNVHASKKQTSLIQCSLAFSLFFDKRVWDEFLPKETRFLFSDVRRTASEVPHEQFGHGDQRGQWQGWRNFLNRRYPHFSALTVLDNSNLKRQGELSQLTIHLWNQPYSNFYIN